MIRDKASRVLLIEDDWLVSEDIRRSVSDAGHDVVGVARDGASGIEQAASLMPDVAIVDIEMPGIDGIATAQRLRDEHRIPVVLLSAHQSAELVERATAAGVGAYLTKPAEAGDVQRALAVARARFDDLLEMERLRDELAAKAEALETALAEVKTLRGFIPICAGCKHVRNDGGFWEQVESYVSRHTEAVFSHSLCQACCDRLYPDQA